MIGFIELLICSVVCFFATDWPLLIVFRVLMGIGFSFGTTASVAAVADVAPASRLGEALGFQGLAFALSLALAPSIAIILAGFGRMTLFGVVTVLFALGAVITFFVKTKRQPVVTDVAADAESGKPPKQRLVAIEVKALRTTIVVAISYCAISLYMAYMPIFAEGTGLTMTTAYFCIAAGVMIVLRAAFGKAFDRYAARTMMVPALIAGALGLLLPLLAPSEITLCLAGACYGVFVGIEQPVLAADAIRRSPIEHKGAASGTFYIGGDVGVIVGSAIWGFTIDVGGFALMFIVALLFVAASAVATYTLLR